MGRTARLAAALLLVAACRTAPAARPLAPGDPRPARLVTAWNESAKQRLGLRGTARLAVDGGEGDLRIRSRQRLALERPSSLRVELLGFLDQSLGVLVSDGERFEFFRAEDRHFESGPVRDRLLWEHAYLDLSVEEAIGLLLSAPILDPSLVPARAWETPGGGIQVDLADERGAVLERVAFVGAARVAWLEVRGEDGGVEWRARFGDYRGVARADVAPELVLDVAAGGTHAEISLRDVELNPELPPGIFQLRGPAEGEPPAAPPPR